MKYAQLVMGSAGTGKVHALEVEPLSSETTSDALVSLQRTLRCNCSGQLACSRRIV